MPPYTLTIEQKTTTNAIIAFLVVFFLIIGAYVYALKN